MGIILNFHEVHDPLWLENIICFLKKEYNPVPMSELISLYNDRSNLKNICHLTVDDGDRSFYNEIYPVLKKHKMPATIFVSPDAAVNQVNFWFQEIAGYENQNLLKIISEVINIKVNDIKDFRLIDIFTCLTINLIWEIINRYQKKYNLGKKPCQNMCISELKDVENSRLITIGAHTLRHPILANEEMSVSKNEITLSITGLADVLGHEINCFAYPNGEPVLDFGQREMDILKDNGCTCAFSTVSGNFNLRSNLLNMPRYGLLSGDSTSYLKTKLFFGAHWNKIMKLKPGNEFASRKALAKLMRK